MKIVIPDPIWGIPEKYWQQIRDLGGQVYADAPADRAEAAHRIKDAEIITINFVKGDAAYIDSAPNLKYIIAPAVGYNWIDTGHAAGKGIKVLNCPTFIGGSVAEHALALLLSLAKRLPESEADMLEGNWEPTKFMNFELAGKTLGLVGYGNIAHHLERMAVGLGMKVVHTNSKSTSEDLDKLLSASDVICLCLPLTDATHHLIDARRLGLLKSSAYLINVARGPIIDQPALLAALKNQQFAGAGLDVFEGEPGRAGAIPDSILELAKLPNVVATPHTAFNTPDALDRKGAEIVANIQSCLDGSPQNVVN